MTFLAALLLLHFTLTLGERYELILNHKDATDDDRMFSERLEVTGLENPNNPNRNTYSIIGRFTPSVRPDYYLEDDDTGYQFKLIYYYEEGPPHQLEWSQTSWLTEETITGFKSINVPDQSHLTPRVRFYGLGLNRGTNSDYSYLDGDGALSELCWNSVGEMEIFCWSWSDTCGIPGFNGSIASSQALFIHMLTDSPTEYPTESPTPLPTDLPTTDPTRNPTVSPTASCEDMSLIYHHDWDSSQSDQKPFSDYSISIDSHTLGIGFDIELQYVGYSSAHFVYGLGASYVIDFEPFQPYRDYINRPGSCANRKADSFEDDSWPDFWSYSENPYLEGHVCSTNDYLAYPPPGDHWSCTMANDSIGSCSKILYSSFFSWDELTTCTNYEGSRPLVSIQTDENWINMSGRLYVEMVTPYSMASEIGVYRVVDVLQSVPFRISVSTSIHVISSTGIRMFLISVIGSSREFAGASTNGAFSVTIVTQTADYMILDQSSVLSAPEYDWQIYEMNKGTCLFPNDRICSQFWEVRTNNISCPVTFGGTFSLMFTAICNPESGDTPECADYLSAYGEDVAHNLVWSYTDDFPCNISSEGILVQFDGSLEFYTDDTFTEEQGTDLYISGTGTVYVEIVAEIPSSVSSTFYVDLVNVWYCTVPPELENEIGIDQANAFYSGCFDIEVVDAGSLTTVMINGESQSDNYAQLIEEPLNEVVRFSFLAPDWLGRDVMFLHCEIEVVLAETETRRRLTVLRRLQEEDVANVQAVLHFMNSFGVEQKKESHDSDMANTFMIVVIGGTVAGVVICLLVVAVGVMFCSRRNKTDQTQGQLMQEIAVYKSTKKSAGSS